MSMTQGKAWYHYLEYGMLTPCSALHRHQRAAVLAEHGAVTVYLRLYGSGAAGSFSLEVQRVTPRFAIHTSLVQNLQLV